MRLFRKKPKTISVPQGKKVLSKEFLLKTSLELRQQEIMFHIYDWEQGDYQEEYDKVIKMQKSYQVIYLLWHVMGEVNNGGYDQYFFNFENTNKVIQPYYQLTDAVLREVGCVALADNYRCAVETYQQMEKTNDEALADKLSELDNEYWNLEREVIRIIDQYIDAHINDFVSAEKY